MKTERKTLPRSNKKDLWIVLVSEVYVHGVFTSFDAAQEYADNECRNFEKRVLPLNMVER